MIFNNSKYNSHWPTKRLDELGEFNRGKSRHRPRNDQRLFENGEYPLIQTGDIKAANLYIESHSDCYNEFGLKQSKLWPENTLCITIAANIAETALLRYPMCFPDSVVGFNAYEDECSEVFMHYIFTYIKRAIQGRIQGSIQDNINIEYLTGLSFKIPIKQERERIESILFNLDSKISLNNRINQELEAMAKLIYDYWFVQFDFPDENGKPYKSSGGKMVYNEQLKREIPEGWEGTELSKIADVISDSIDPSNEPDKAFKYYSIPVWDDTKSYELTKGGEIGSSKYSVNDKRILVSKLNPWFSRVVYATDNEDTICSTEFVVWQPKVASMKCYLYQIAIHPHFIAYSTQNATGTSNSHKRVNPKVMMQYKVAFDEDLAISFSEKIKPFIEQMQNNQKQNQKLSELRDWLLPMLMNGQVTVGEAKEYVQDGEVRMAAEPASADKEGGGYG